MDSAEHADASLPLRWAVSPGTLQALKAQEARDPHLLLCIVQKYPNGRINEIQRLLIPFEYAMHYISFPRPGTFMLYATIVWPKEKWAHSNDLRGNFLRKDWDYYRMRLFRNVVDEAVALDIDSQENSSENDEGEVFDGSREIEFAPDRHNGPFYGVIDCGELELVVGKEFFAKEPPQWLSDWVNCWFESPARNSCQFRKRTIMAFTIQPVLLGIGALFLEAYIFVNALILFLIGGVLKGEVFLSPFEYCWHNNPGELLSNNSRWFIPLHKSIFYFPLVPGFWLSCGLIGRSLHVHHIGAFIAVCMLVMFALLVAIVGVALFLQNCAEKSDKKPAESTESQREKDRIRHFYATKMNGLTDTGDALAPSLSSLPPEKRTIRLRLQELKAKYCKLYAR
ncbi:MAG: hypothetical protein KGI50_01260 [Patescibacteria group bacterium]|nr:hypothetical protein [Patescibacteria group bacterium]